MPGHSSATRTWLTAILVLIAAGIIAYFVGGALARMESARQVTAVQAQLTSANTRMSALQSVNSLLRASNAVYHAVAALDNRNFGTANSYAGTAVADLNAVDANTAGVDAQGLSAAKREAAGINISVARDLAGQRVRLLQLAKAIDAIVPQNAAPASN